MSASSFPESESRVAGQLAYGALFVIALPLLLALWAIALDRRIELPAIGSRTSGIALAILGALMIVSAVVALRVKGGGWPMSPYPPRAFVTSGVYALVAHPLYLGSVLLALGVSIVVATPAGMWIVTPVLAAACIAFVWGSEGERTLALFGARESRPLLHLPDATSLAPAFADRISVCFLALLPWLIVYEAINRLATPRDAIVVATSWDARIPVIGWTELVYFLAYPIVLIAPFVAKTRADLRTLTIHAWIATAGSALCYLVVPTLFAKKPVPPSTFAPMLEWERAFHAPNTALPAFHVIWPMLTMQLYARAFPRSRALHWPVVIAIAISCVTTGMHAIADVIAGLTLGIAFTHLDAIWRALTRVTEIISASWREWRIGSLRMINHGLYAGAAVAIGVALVIALAGENDRIAVLVIAASVIIGAALWAQWIEGSSALLRPYGYYGGVIGGGIAIALTGELSLLAAFAAASPFIQAIGRLRCLVQGCCHGRPTPAIGIRVTHPMSRIVRIAALGGVSLHPTPLYSILMNLAFGAILVRMWIAGAPLTFIAGTHFILAGLGRFIEEHYRGEPQTRVIAGLRMYQWLAIASVIAGAVLTTIPSASAPPMSALSMMSIVAALTFGVIGYVAYGVDFPESNRRFARLA